MGRFDVLYLRGQKKELTKFVTNLRQKLDLSFEQIADLAGTTVDFVKSVHQQVTSK